VNDDLCMDLADCGSPEALLRVIFEHHTDWPQKVPVRELAESVGIIEFQDIEVEGFVGALMTDDAKNKGVILTKVGQPLGRHRFTVAHELGHFLIPSHRGNRQCTAADLREQRRDTTHRKQESEANRFAAGLLMYKPRFARDIDLLGDADVSHVITLSKQYGTSVEATANRYVDLSEDTCAFVFSKDGVVRYARPKRGFPQLAVRKGDRLPDACYSHQAPATPLRAPTDWAELDGSVWLQTEFGKPVPAILEQSMRQRDGYQVTLLIALIADDEDVAEEKELEDSWRIGFRR